MWATLKVLFKHPLSTSRSLPIRPFSSWYDYELIDAKQERRRREKQYRTLLKTKRMGFYNNQGEWESFQCQGNFWHSQSASSKEYWKNTAKTQIDKWIGWKTQRMFSQIFLQKNINIIRQCLINSRQPNSPLNNHFRIWYNRWRRSTEYHQHILTYM